MLPEGYKIRRGDTLRVTVTAIHDLDGADNYLFAKVGNSVNIDIAVADFGVADPELVSKSWRKGDRVVASAGIAAGVVVASEESQVVVRLDEPVDDDRFWVLHPNSLEPEPEEEPEQAPVAASDEQQVPAKEAK